MRTRSVSRARLASMITQLSNLKSHHLPGDLLIRKNRAVWTQWPSSRSSRRIPSRDMASSGKMSRLVRKRNCPVMQNLSSSYTRHMKMLKLSNVKKKRGKHNEGNYKESKLWRWRKRSRWLKQLQQQSWLTRPRRRSKRKAKAVNDVVMIDSEVTSHYKLTIF